jgi:hypothetical protein
MDPSEEVLNMMHRGLVVSSLCLSALVGLVGCGDDSGELKTVSTSVCSSGKRWEGGDEGSALMHPGSDCIKCHTERGEGPSFVLAGTVHSQVAEADECAGVAGAQVQITDANQKAYTLTTNEAGNFFLETRGNTGFAFPYTARVTYQGRESAMTTAPSTGQCASCHTPQGLSGAPGRIVAP